MLLLRPLTCEHLLVVSDFVVRVLLCVLLCVVLCVCCCVCCGCRRAWRVSQGCIDIDLPEAKLEVDMHQLDASAPHLTCTKLSQVGASTGRARVPFSWVPLPADMQP